LMRKLGDAKLLAASGGAGGARVGGEVMLTPRSNGDVGARNEGGGGGLDGARTPPLQMRGREGKFESPERPAFSPLSEVGGG